MVLPLLIACYLLPSKKPCCCKIAFSIVNRRLVISLPGADSIFKTKKKLNGGWSQFLFLNAADLADYTSML